MICASPCPVIPVSVPCLGSLYPGLPGPAHCWFSPVQQCDECDEQCCLDVGITESNFLCVRDETRINKHLCMIMFELVKILMLLKEY